MSATLAQAIAAIKAGDKAIGQHLLAEVLKAEPNNEKAWLWLASLLDRPEQRRKCLEQVLAINPDNELAQRGLTTLKATGLPQLKPGQPGQLQTKVATSPAEPKSPAAHRPLRPLPSRSMQTSESQSSLPSSPPATTTQTLSSAAALHQIAAARTRGVTPDLSGANLGRADLAGADLSEASLHDIDLSRANLRQANLCYSNLTKANLSGVNLRGAKLNGTTLVEANLSGANLSGANLNGAHLQAAKLIGANLSHVHLGWADLSQVNLRGADLSGANLDGANLREAILTGIIYTPQTKWPVGFTPPKSASSTGQSFSSRTAPARQEATKTCPYCAETIKLEAVVCRFCGRDLPVDYPAPSWMSEPTYLDSPPPAPLESVAPGVAQEKPVTGEALPWDEVWLRVITKPSVATFEGILRDPRATAGRAYLWIMMATLIGLAAQTILAIGVDRIPRLSALKEFGPSAATTPAILACALLLAPFVSILGLMLTTGINQLFARMFGGTGTYAKLVYARAAYLAPLNIVMSPLGAIPLIGYVNLLIGLYLLVLEVIAMKAVNRFGWGAAIVSVILPGLALGMLLACAIFVITFLLIGAAVNNEFKF